MVDPRDLRPAAGRHGQASRLPQLHHEAGDPGGVHPGRGDLLHAGGERLQARHFDDQVLAQNKISGAARAMVVTNGIERAIQYYHAICDYLVERKSRYQKLVASSGEEARRVRARLSQRRRHLLRCAPKGAVREYRLR